MIDEKLFRDLVNLLLSSAEDRRDEAREREDQDAGDYWSAIAGNIDNARQRMRK